MKQDVERIIEIPEGVVVEISRGSVKVKKDDKNLERDFNFGMLKINKTEKEVKISCKNSGKWERKTAGTIAAHIQNMIKGVGEDFVYKLEICNVHFPMNVKVDGEKIVIKSFLGESVERVAKIVSGAKVEVKGNEITITSPNREIAGQTAANIEKATRLSGRDRRVFQDGIFITEKPGRDL